MLRLKPLISQSLRCAQAPLHRRWLTSLPTLAAVSTQRSLLWQHRLTPTLAPSPWTRASSVSDNGRLSHVQTRRANSGGGGGANDGGGGGGKGKGRLLLKASVAVAAVAFANYLWDAPSRRLRGVRVFLQGFGRVFRT
jgi:hypothetical protein